MSKPSTLERALALLAEHTPASGATSRRLHRESLYRLRLLMQYEGALSGRMPSPACVDLSRAEEVADAACEGLEGRARRAARQKTAVAVLAHHGMSRAEISERTGQPDNRVAWQIESADPNRLRLALAIMEGTSNG